MKDVSELASEPSIMAKVPCYSVLLMKSTKCRLLATPICILRCYKQQFDTSSIVTVFSLLAQTLALDTTEEPTHEVFK